MQEFKFINLTEKDPVTIVEAETYEEGLKKARAQIGLPELPSESQAEDVTEEAEEPVNKKSKKKA